MSSLNNFPLVTIGVPCYNVEKFIAFSIISVLRQTYQNFELIITDDGSTDGTLDVIRQFKDDRIILIADGENHGISYRLNQQINMARGEYFIRMDGDDIMYQDRVEKQVKFLEENPEIDVVGAAAVIINEKNEITGLRSSSNIPKFPEDVVNNTTFIHPTVAGKLSFFKKHLYDEGLCGVEDKDLWCRGIVEGKYSKLREPLMYYRDFNNVKLKTYLFRKKQGRKQIIKRWSLFHNKWEPTKYLINSYLKSVIILVLYGIKLDSLRFHKQNSMMSIPNLEEYQRYLDTIVGR